MGFFQDILDDIKKNDIKQSPWTEYLDKVKKNEEYKSGLMNEYGVVQPEGKDNSSTAGKGDYSRFVSEQNALLARGKLILSPLDKDLPITFSKGVNNKFTPALRAKFKQLAYDYYNEFGEKLNVNDGFRQRGDNYYSTNSLHSSGNAIDVAGGTKERTKWIADRAYLIGFGAIDTGKSKSGNYFVHVDVGPKRTYTYGPPGYMVCDTYVSPDKPWRG